MKAFRLRKKKPITILSETVNGRIIKLVEYYKYDPDFDYRYEVHMIDTNNGKTESDGYRHIEDARKLFDTWVEDAATDCPPSEP